MIMRICFLFLCFVLLTFKPALAVEVQEVNSPSGITALLVEDHSNPIIALRLAFRGGAALDPVSQAGLADLVSSLIDEGAGDLDSQAFQGKLEDLSITIRFSAGKDSFRGTLTTLTENRDEAFQLLNLALTQPRFDEEPVERIRAQILSGLRQDLEDPDAIAGKTLFATLFRNHPYANPSSGTVESVSNISQADMRKFTKNRFALDNLIIGVTGDITPDELGTLLDKTFAALPKQAVPWQITSVEADDLKSGILVTKKPVPQSVILFTQPGIPRHDPDFYAAYVLNHILGGGSFTSRLYQEVREKRGLAYSAYSYLADYAAASLILGGAATQNARAKETIDVITDQWKKIADKGVTQREYDDTITYMTGSYPLRFTSSGSIANMLVGIQLDELGNDYFDKRNAYIQAVSLKDVNRVAKRLLDPKKLLFVVVGEPVGIESTVAFQ